MLEQSANKQQSDPSTASVSPSDAAVPVLCSTSDIWENAYRRERQQREALQVQLMDVTRKLEVATARDGPVSWSAVTDPLSILAAGSVTAEKSPSADSLTALGSPGA